MKYQFSYRTSALDFWQLSMYYVYGSVAGVCNIIFTVAMFLLAIVQWNNMNMIFRLLVIGGCCLFTIIHPSLVYNSAKKKANAITEDTNIGFDDIGIHVSIGDKSETIKWKSIKRISKKPTMIIIFSDTTHGYVLCNRVLGNYRKELYDFIVSKIDKK